MRQTQVKDTVQSQKVLVTCDTENMVLDFFFFSIFPISVKVTTELYVKDKDEYSRQKHMSKDIRGEQMRYFVGKVNCTFLWGPRSY